MSLLSIVFQTMSPPKDLPAPYRGESVNSQLRDSLVRLCHQWRRLRPRTTLGATRGGQAHQESRKVGQRRRQVLEGHLRAKEVLMGPPASLPYQEQSGHHLA